MPDTCAFYGERRLNKRLIATIKTEARKITAILQKILFPYREICDVPEMYLRTQDTRTDFFDGNIKISDGETVSFDTYFNSFSIQKWMKYTVVDNVALRLRVSGSFCIALFSATNSKDAAKETLLYKKTVAIPDAQYYEFTFPTVENDEIVFFRLTACGEGATLYNADYITNIGETSLRDINIALNMCTYRREEFICKTLKNLGKDIFSNPESPLYGHLYAYVIDNDGGKKLDKQQLGEHENIRLFTQADLGASGGFARGMLEIEKDEAQKNITHFVIMDDDIILHPETLVRLYMFLRCLRPEMDGRFIGGAIFDLVSKWHQHGSGGERRNIRSVWRKGNRDTRKVYNVIDNEIEEPTNYNGWWFCCVSIDSLKRLGYPFPMYMKADDVEYGLRNRAPVITLNGILVWHENMFDKYAPFTEYYNTRNTLYLHMLHDTEVSFEDIEKDCKVRLRNNLFSYRYKSVDLICQAIEDALRGGDWLKEHDSEQLFTEIMKEAYSYVPFSQLSVPFQRKKYFDSLNYQENGTNRLWRLITLNGVLLKANRVVISTAIPQNPGVYYRASTVLNCNVKKEIAFVTEKNLLQFIKSCGLCIRTLYHLKTKHNSVKQEIRERFAEITSSGSWHQHLKLE